MFGAISQASNLLFQSGYSSGLHLLGSASEYIDYEGGYVTYLTDGPSRVPHQQRSILVMVKPSPAPKDHSKIRGRIMTQILELLAPHVPEKVFILLPSQDREPFEIRNGTQRA